LEEKEVKEETYSVVEQLPEVSFELVALNHSGPHHVVELNVLPHKVLLFELYSAVPLCHHESAASTSCSIDACSTYFFFSIRFATSFAVGLKRSLVYCR